MWNRQFIFRFFILWVPLVLLVLISGWLIYLYERNIQIKLTRSNAQHLAQLAQTYLESELEGLRGDALYLSKLSSLSWWVNTGNKKYFNQLKSDLRNFAIQRGHYDQVRYLDNQGRERVRVNYSYSKTVLVPDNQLQNKADRYYVPETLGLPKGKLYVSPFDLNIEHGKIEQPIKPTIRLSTPVFDQHNRKRGLITLNFLGQQLLDRLRDFNNLYGGTVWLVNENGYWLFGPKPNLEWGFMYPERKDQTIGNTLGKVWSLVQSGKKSDNYLDNHDNLYSFRIMGPAKAVHAVSGKNWVIISHIPLSLDGQLVLHSRQIVTIAALVITLLTVLSVIITQSNMTRRHYEQKLKESENQYRNLTESAPDAIVVTNSEGNITYSNIRAEQTFGYGRDELLNQSIEVIIPAGFCEKHILDHGQLNSDSKPRDIQALDGIFALHKDGSEIPVEVSLHYASSQNGTLVTSIIRDVTRRYRQAQQIKELNVHLQNRTAELETVNQELESFSYSVSHDLRTPLRAINGFSSILLSDHAEQLDEVARRHLNRVRTATQHMANLIDNLINLSKLSNSQITKTKVNLSKIAEDILATLQEMEANRNVSIRIQSDMLGIGDEFLLRIVISNLINNAWKFTDKCQPGVIEFSTTQLNGKQVFFIKDNGAGFDMKYADKLFGVFQRLHTDEEYSGTGIGLATVQRIIHKHGGQVWAESEPEQGATFYFTLG